MQQIGDRVKALRTEKNLRPELVAAALGVSLQTIRNIEANKGMNARRVAPLAKFFGVTSDYLLGMTEARSPGGQAEGESGLD